MKLLLLPMIVTVIFKLMGLSYEWIVFFAAVAAMPSASSVCMFSDLYDIKPSFSAHTVGVSSVLSVLTLPVVMLAVDVIARLPLYGS